MHRRLWGSTNIPQSALKQPPQQKLLMIVTDDQWSPLQPYKANILMEKILIIIKSLNSLCNVFEKLGYVKILRTSVDALTAGDARRCLSAVFGGLDILLL